jgi:hypothetical protein
MIEVTGVHIETFTIFATWLVNKSNNNVFGPLHQNPISGYYWPAGMPLIELYIFAEEYEIPQLGEDALRRFTSLIYHAGDKDCTPHSFAVNIETVPTLDEINYIYERTAADCPLRPVVVDAFCAADEDMDYSLMTANREFLVDVIMQQQKNQEPYNGIMGFRCREHEEPRRREASTQTEAHSKDGTVVGLGTGLEAGEQVAQRTSRSISET